jgi:hypothetical protein
VNFKDARQLVRFPRRDLEARIFRDDFINHDGGTVFAARRCRVRSVERCHRRLHAAWWNANVGTDQADIAELDARSDQSAERCARLEGAHRNQGRQPGVGIPQLNAQAAPGNRGSRVDRHHRGIDVNARGESIADGSDEMVAHTFGP